MTVPTRLPRFQFARTQLPFAPNIVRFDRQEGCPPGDDGRLVHTPNRDEGGTVETEAARPCGSVGSFRRWTGTPP